MIGFKYNSNYKKTRNLNDNLYKMIINPTKELINEKSSWIIYESCLNPNKIKNRINGKKHSIAYAKM